MSNDLVPQQPQSALSEILEKLNLPELIAGPAGRAISRLVAGVVEIPAAYLDSFAQSIKDKAEAKQNVNKEVAAAAAKLAASDMSIVARAAHNLLAKEFRHQQNKEQIIRKTIEVLKEDQPSAGEGDARKNPPSDVDEDWLNIFERFAQDASSDKMQSLWARVLAGEIRKPQSFSLKSLRFIAELDQGTAQKFERYVPFIIFDAIPIEEHTGPAFSDLLYLQNSDLVTGVGGILSKTFTLNDKGKAIFPHQGRYIIVTGEANQKVTVTCAVLTKVGLEMTSIINVPFSISAAREVANLLPKTGLTEIELADGTNTPKGLVFTPAGKLWKKPQTLN